MCFPAFTFFLNHPDAGRISESVKYITALAIVAALSCAAFAAFASPAVHASATAFHKPDKPVVIAAPEFRYESACVLRAIEFSPDAIPAPVELQRAQRHYTPILAVTNPVKTKGVASFSARTLAVARSTI